MDTNVYFLLSEYIDRKDYQGMSVDSLFKALKLEDDKFVDLVKSINKLEEENKVFINENKVYSCLNANTYKAKVIKVLKYSIVLELEDKSRLSCENEDSMYAYLNDEVYVSLYNKKPEVVSIINRACYQIAVIYKKHKIYPIDNSFFFRIDCNYPFKENGLYLLKINKYINNVVKCEYLKTINDKDRRIFNEIIKSNLHFEFEDNIIKEALKVSTKDFALKSRVNLTDKLIVTIDGIDAKDLDDAISLEYKDNGNYLLGVHIADISYFIEEDSILDKEALSRSFSIYLPDRVIPMLPESISNGVCSLNAFSIKPTISCFMEIDNKGEIISYDIQRSYIESKGRLDYDTVNNLFNHKETNLSNDIKEMLFNMLILSKILSKKMINRGYIELDIPEAKVLLDKNNTPIDVIIRSQNEAEKLIENFMIAANETVASYIYNMNLPFVYRVHDKIDIEKAKNLIDNLEDINVKPHFAFNSNIRPIQIANLLKEYPQYKDYLSETILRCMSKAFYSTNNIGHFGLASSCYTHFTSPIRRYPDLLVHRLLTKYLIDNNFEVDNIRLANDCNKCSIIERKVLELERNCDDIKMAEYIKQYINKSFDGYVTGFVNNGVFVKLDANQISGFMPYPYNVELHIASKVNIVVDNVNVDNKQIDFRFVKLYNK